jgi:CRP-like cAMP-binding protein
MSEHESIWYLENLDLLSFICPTKLSNGGEEVMHEATKHYKKGEFIFFPDQDASSIYLLHSGRVKIGSYSDDGREIIKAILQPGEIFGELAILGEEKRTEFAQALDDKVGICVMPLDDMRKLMYEDKSFSLKVTRWLGLRIQRTERRLESLVFRDARGRVIDFLKDLAKEKGKKVGTETLVNHFFTHKDIASLTATSRQTVTSILNELREQNLIYFDRKRLLIRDLEKLA